MALNYWNDTNKIESELLNHQYHSELDLSFGLSGLYTCERVTTKRYLYVGLSKPCALSCLANKRQKYRGISKSEKIEGGLYIVVPEVKDIASVAAVHQDGNLYTVDIDVNAVELGTLIRPLSAGDPTPTDIDRCFHLSSWDEDGDLSGWGHI